MADFIDRQIERDVRTCDSCGQLIDLTDQPGRWRHRDCPPPPMPPAAQEVFAMMNRLRRKQ